MITFTILVAILLFALDFLITGLLVWIGCFALGLLGISVAFSWKIVFAIWILVIIIKILFEGNK